MTRRIDVYGVTPEFATTRNRKVAFGRFISERDVDTSAPVAVLRR